MTTETVVPVSTRKGFRFGLVALIFAIVGPLWLVLGLISMIQAQSGYAPGDPVEEANGGDILRYLFVVVGYLVVPALLLLAIAFAIVALVRNRKPGVILAASALGLLLLFVIAFVVLIAQLFEGISRVS